MYFKTTERTEIDTTSNFTFHTPEPILSNTAFYPNTVRDWNTLDLTILEKSANSETLTTFSDLIRSSRLD